MEKIVSLTITILIFLSISFSLNTISASDNSTNISNWTNITVDGVNFELPPEYKNGNFSGVNNTTYMLETVFDFSINSMYSESRLENEYGYESTHEYLTSIDEEKVGKHDVILLHSHRYICGHNVTYAFFVVNKTIYSVSYNGFNLTKNLKKMIKNTPKSNITKKEFLKQLDKAQYNYLEEQEEYDEDEDYYDYSEYRSSIREKYKNNRKPDFTDYYIAYRLSNYFMNKKY